LRGQPEVSHRILLNIEDVFGLAPGLVVRGNKLFVHRVKAHEALSEGTNPEDMLRIHEQGVNIIGRKLAGHTGLGAKGFKGLVFEVEPAESASEGGNPEGTVVVGLDGEDGVIRQGIGVSGLLSERGEGKGIEVEVNQSAAEGTDPEGPVLIGIEGFDVIGGEVGVVSHVETGNVVVRGVEPAQAAVVGANPEVSVLIFGQDVQVVDGQGRGIVGDMVKGLELVAIVSVQAIAGSIPEVTLAILQNIIHLVARYRITCFWCNETCHALGHGINMK